MKKPRREWATVEIEVLRDTYPDYPTDAIAKAMGRTIPQVYRKAQGLGLKKSEAYLASLAATLGDKVGKETRFKPGHTSWNKGTRFEAGVPIGTERISKDGYLQRKINDDMPFQKRWRAVHILNWEAINGPLPKGHALAFRDGDKRNTAVDNLELITRAELMRRNAYHRYPKEIALLIQLKGQITRQLNKRERKAA